MWHTLLDKALRQLIVVDTLDLTWPDGQQVRYGRGPNPVAATLHNKDVIRGLVLRPDLTLGNAYMNGDLTVADDDIDGLLSLLMRNRQQGHTTALMDAARKAALPVQRIARRNPLTRARANVAHHYDLSSQLYDLFLDRDRQYSCAYFRDPSMSLDDAQEAKKHHIARKLCLRPDMRVLDIGCGWGGMALTLARDHGARVTGVTLSKNQHATARARAEAAGLADACDFRLQDYRTLTERFDRIVSVGMLEHVGLPQYDAYFGRVHDLLTDDGVALIHTIGRVAPPSPTSPWIDKYIFPGGYVPSLSDLAPSLERSGLWQADIEVLRGHYGPTLNHWRQRFESRLDTVREMYDDRFIRMWRFYLVASETAFEEMAQVVFQFQLSRRQHTVPATRDYLYPDAGALLRAAE